MSELRSNMAMSHLADIFIRVYLEIVPRVHEGFLTVPGLETGILATLAQVRARQLIAHVAQVHMSSLIRAANDIATGCIHDWHQDADALDRTVSRFAGILGEYLAEWRSRLDRIVAKWNSLDPVAKKMVLSLPIYAEGDEVVYGFI